MFQGELDSRFCSNACSIRNRGADWWIQHQQRMNRKKHSKRVERVEQRLAPGGFTPEQRALIDAELHRAYANGWMAGRRAGWREACGEHEATRPIKKTA